VKLNYNYSFSNIKIIALASQSITLVNKLKFLDPFLKYWFNFDAFCFYFLLNNNLKFYFKKLSFNLTLKYSMIY